MYIQDFDSNGNVLASESLSVASDDFRFFRGVLRFCGFWHPIKATFKERIIYPLGINMVLFIILVLNLYLIVTHFIEHDSNQTADYVLETSTSIARYISAWLGHALTVKYFKKRNLEKELFDIEMVGRCKREVKAMLRSLNAMLVASLFHAVVSFALAIVAGEYLHYPSRWIADNEISHKQNTTKSVNIEGAGLYVALTSMISASDIYIVPTLFCLTWLMYLLSQTCRMRLLRLKSEYMAWNKHAEDAVFRHYTLYTTKLQSNCKALKLLFISHNVFMVIITPQLFYLCVEIGKKKAALDLAIFLYYLVIHLTSWVAPLYFAEAIRSEEEIFCNDVNNFCPQYFAMQREREDSDDCYALRTFRSRREVNKLVSYLKSRKSGFLVGCYSFHLQLSMLSFYLGLLTFVVRIMS